MKRLLVVISCAISICAAQVGYGRLPEPEKAALGRIKAEGLHSDTSYLASDELAGRDTPSIGLDMAADYIAAHFRQEGLEPAGSDGSYFQVAQVDRVTPQSKGVRLELKSGNRKVEVTAVIRTAGLTPVDVDGLSVLKVPSTGVLPVMTDRIVAADEQVYGSPGGIDALQSEKPKLIVLIGRTRDLPPAVPYLEEHGRLEAPVLQVRDSQAAALLLETAELTLSAHVPAPTREQFALRNVVGVLRGSDPVLREQYIILSAHYDHLGQNAQGIFHGANDNASGTASVIEIGNALASLEPHPKRSILFVTFFGEEKRLLGSTYYTHHPVVPLKATVANVNLEQMGRTDDITGPKIATFSVSGESLSNLASIMTGSAITEGVKFDSRSGADDYFERSDNFPFAKEGIVAHTIGVAGEFPGYHGLGDTADKIDFDNMAKVARGVAAGIIELANRDDLPRWSDSSAAARYRK
jgi:hypothetical protein